MVEEEKEHSGFNDDDRAKAITFIKLLPTTQTIKLKWRRVSVSLVAANCDSVCVCVVTKTCGRNYHHKHAKLSCGIAS